MHENRFQIMPLKKLPVNWLSHESEVCDPFTHMGKIMIPQSEFFSVKSSRGDKLLKSFNMNIFGENILLRANRVPQSGYT